MRISFVLPCYNMEKYLPTCLDSLLRQNLEASDYEIIVVNDGSKDNTLSIARDYELKIRNLIIIDKENGGVGSARNTGYRQASGNYIYFLDPDDYLANNMLEIIVSLAENNNLDMLGFESLELKLGEKLMFKSSFETLKAPLVICSGQEYIATSNYRNEAWWYIVKKSFLEQHKISFMEDKLMEDVIFTWEVLLNVQKMAFATLDVHRYRIVPNSIRTSKEPRHYRKSVFDCESAVLKQAELLIEYQITNSKTLKRLKTKQESVVFFLIIRLIRSDISLLYVPSMLKRFRELEAYPLKRFYGEDFKGIIYRTLSTTMNYKMTLYPFMLLLRYGFRINFFFMKKYVSISLL